MGNEAEFIVKAKGTFFFYVLIVTDFGVYWLVGTLSFRRGRDGSQCRFFLRDEI